MATTVMMKSFTSSNAAAVRQHRYLRSSVACAAPPITSVRRARGSCKPQALYISAYGPSSCRPARYNAAPRLGLGLAQTTINLLDNLLLTPDRLSGMASSCIHPMEIRTLEDRYELQSDCPGMGEEDVTVEVSPDRVITIAGSRKRKTAAAPPQPPQTASQPAEAESPGTVEAEPPEVPQPTAAEAEAATTGATAEAENEQPSADSTTSFEISYRFRRSFMLPDDADAENITAALDRGVLTVKVPRKVAEAPKPRRIRVSGGAE